MDGQQGRTVQKFKDSGFNTRTWAKLIGWFQTVRYLIVLIVHMHYWNLILVGRDVFYEERDIAKKVDLAASTVWIVIYIIGLVAGIVLIKGVQGENLAKLNYWLIIQGGFCSFMILRCILQIVLDDYTDTFTVDVFEIIYNVFFIRVVLSYKTDLSHASV